jgi:hypothetical protein
MPAARSQAAAGHPPQTVRKQTDIARIADAFNRFAHL